MFQIVSLLNDLQSCSHEKISKILDRSASVTAFLTRYRSLFDDVTYDLIQCARTTRQIILNELKFCYLFSNFRSRVYGGVDYVVQFNDIAFHPVFAGVTDLVIYLDTVVEVNCDTATAYIARFVE